MFSFSGVRAGSIFIVLAASLWGTTGTVRAFAPAAATPVSVGAARIVVGGVLLFFLAWPALPKLRVNATPRVWAMLAAAAVCVAVFQTSYFASVAKTGVAVGTIVTIGSGPAFAGLISRLTGGAPLTRRWVLATIGAVIGCALLVGGGQVNEVGVAFALLSGVSYATYATAVSRLIQSGLDEVAVAGATFGIAALLLMPVLLGGEPGWVLGGTGLLVALYLGAITTTGGYLLYVRGLRTTPITVATTLTLVEPAIAAVLGLVVLGERLSVAGYAGLVLIAASLVALLRD